LDKPRYRRYAVEIATVILLVSTLIIEAGQFFLPERFTDLTDIALSVGAALGGYWVIYTIQTRYLLQLVSESLPQGEQHINNA
jgi:VanZ family protein